MTDMSQVFGEQPYRYQLVEDWPQMPVDIPFVEAIGVSVDSADNVYVFNRGEPAVFVFRPDGSFVETWGDALRFHRPHGITIADDLVYLTDDLGHRVVRCDLHGQQPQAIGPQGNASETGIEGFDYRMITRRAGPYNLPTNVAVAEDGSIFVADGYGNAAVHVFTADGQYVRSWGAPGTKPGEFQVPHGICLGERGRVFVADRENSRIQVFGASGKLEAIWNDVVRPCQVIYNGKGAYLVAELGDQNGRFPWQPRPALPVGGRLSILDDQGRLLSRWGGGWNPHQPDGFYACHDVCIDSQGDVYVGEVAVTAALAGGDDPTGLKTLKKFCRLRS